MVDFDKLRKKRAKTKSTNPLEIFRRLPKPSGLTDLYNSQAEVLNEWYSRRNEQDLVIKLHTGGGKTLVGLLIGQSILNEANKPVLYLTLNNQLVEQTIEKATELGIPTVQYGKSEPLSEKFLNAEAIMVMTYKALFNGRTKFGRRGKDNPIHTESIIMDDAHAAFSIIRDSFTLNINIEDNKSLYQTLTSLFRNSFKQIDKQGTFDEVVSGQEYDILEVPFESWYNKLDAVHQILLQNSSNNHMYVWPLLRDNLKYCHALISRRTFTITPLLPFINIFPTFDEAKKRIYMSATISDDSDIIKTFGTNKNAIKKMISSRTLAGINERMILIPRLMNFDFKEDQTSIKKIIQLFTNKNLGTAILVPSNKVAEAWKNISSDPQKPINELINSLRNETREKPAIFINRYDGIDLPGDSCRLLIMNGAPYGNLDYDQYKANVLYNSNILSHKIAQRIEQGMGRGARGSGDYCVILFVGKELASWVGKKVNYNFLTQATKAQLEIGMEITSDIQNLDDLINTIDRCISRDNSWIEYQAETLAELIDNEELIKEEFIEEANIERKVFDLWQNNLVEQAISKLIKYLEDPKTKLDSHSKGWLEQLVARMYYEIGNIEKSEEYQKKAFFNNKNLFKPKSPSQYQLLTPPSKQAKEICKQINEYQLRQSFLSQFDEIASLLTPNSSTNQFEQSLKILGEILGFAAERFDENGEGPDVLWILPDKYGFVIEAKSHKQRKNCLNKKDHGQLLVASEWFKKHYPDYNCIRVSLLPDNKATQAATADLSYALTFANLADLLSELRILISKLLDSQISMEALETKCEQLLNSSNLRPKELIGKYLIFFENI